MTAARAISCGLVTTEGNGTRFTRPLPAEGQKKRKMNTAELQGLTSKQSCAAYCKVMNTIHIRYNEWTASFQPFRLNNWRISVKKAYRG